MRRILLTVALGALACAPPAAAGERFRAGSLFDGPVVAGDGVAWLQGLGPSASVLMTARPGEAPVARLRTVSTVYDSTWLDGGPQGLAFATSAMFSPSHYEPPEVAYGNVWRGGPAGPLEPVLRSRCETGSVEIDGALLAYARQGCAAGEQGPVVVFGDRALRAGTNRVHVAGRHLAFAGADRPGSVVVYDTVADAEVLRTGGEPGGPLLDLVDLQADGKVVVAVRGETAAAWLSPAEPALHRLPVRASEVVRLDGDRLLVSRRGTLVELVGLDGARRTLATAHPSSAISWGDLAGDRVAFSRPTCRGADVWLRGVDEEPLAFAAQRAPCRVRLRAPARVMFGEVAAAIARVPVRCHEFGALAPCGEVLLRAPDGTRLTGRPAPYEEFASTDDLHLTGAGVRRIARRGRMLVRVEVWSYARPGRMVQRAAATLVRATPRALRDLRGCLRRGIAAGRCAEG